MKFPGRCAISCFRHGAARGVRPLYLTLLWLLFTLHAWAGPPFITDDPEPVGFRHWEIYLSSQNVHTVDGWSGTLPHVEINFGAMSNLQIHLIAPFAFDAPFGQSRHYGYGDTEVGLKYRFIKESSRCPMIGTFPQIEIPTGDRRRGLGNGKMQLFLPLWMQKSFGKWTTYGGIGYLINPGQGNRNGWFIGWQVQRQVLRNLALGGEIFHRTPLHEGETAATNFNLGLVLDLSGRHHLLASAGRSITGPTRFQCYIGYQLTFGPGA